MDIEVNNKILKLSNLNKTYWLKEKITKGQLINYYVEISNYILPYLMNRPLVLKRYPDGIDGKCFYQKKTPNFTPSWINIQYIKNDKDLSFRPMIMINNLETLIWVVNLGCIEMHPWLSKKDALDHPDLVVIDLDPQTYSSFNDVLNIAIKIKEILKAINIRVYPKTSGSKGLHLYMSIEPNYNYLTVRNTMKNFFKYLVNVLPNNVSIQLNKDKRQGKIYLDYLQNSYGKTMVSVYSPRPLSQAPVSMPLTWDEIEIGQINPLNFNLSNALKRIKEKGDLFQPILENKQDFSLLVQTFLK